MRTKLKVDFKSIFVAVAISCAIVAVCLFINSKKVNYHMDEICTFGLSNGVLHMEHELGKVYTGEELFRDYVTADENNRFNYRTVWENQKKDVHPPLYYIFIHTLSSLIPGQYTDLIGLLPNILFAIIIYWQMYWMFCRVTEKTNALVLAGLYMLTAAFTNIVVFFRMYTLLTLLTNAVFMLFLKYMPFQKKDKWFYIGLYATVACGMLTHYYFAVICCVACAVYGLQMLFAKQMKDLIYFVTTGVAGVATAVVLFPKMLHHIFLGYRGRQAVTALISDGLYDSVKQILSLIDVYLFGGLFTVVLISVLVIWLVALKSSENEMIKYFIVQFALPVLVYICCIAKIAPYKNERYITNVTGIIWFVIFAAILIAAKSYKTKSIVFALAVAVTAVIFSYQNGLPNLQKENAWKNTILDQRTTLPCVYVYDHCWRVIPNYVEMQKLQQITFLDPSTLDMIDDDRYKNNEAMLVYISNEVVGTDYLDRIIANNPDIEGYEMLFYSGYSACYLLD